MSRTDALVEDHLRRWAEDLVDLTRRNHLLYFKHTKSASLEFVQDAAAIDAHLARRSWGFHMPAALPEDGEPPAPVTPRPDELVVTPPRDRASLERALKTLRTRAEAEFLDAGIWVLYLGLGRLNWVDVDGKDACSPLLLLPVTLTLEGSAWECRLQRSEDGEPALNPALAVKLERDFGIELPSLDDLDEVDAPSVMAAVQEALPPGSTWTVDPTTVLRTFTFHKEVIYRDLREHAAQITSHPTVRLLAEGPTGEAASDMAFEPQPEDALDQIHPPEELTCVVDADGTQRQCLIAAREGRSFVMDGPPGTGKSQTITNVIAQLLADNKTVLFVSEKAAALDVVHTRLAALHLDPFVLSLHSRTATRKAVAAELGRALDERPVATSRFDTTSRERLMRDRVRLTDYAVAVNERRSPLGRSLHDVVGRVSELKDLDEAPIPDVDTRTLDASAAATLFEAAGQLSRSWGPVQRSDSFIWRDLRDPAGGAAREADLRERLTTCLSHLDDLETATANAAAELRLPPPEDLPRARHLVAVLDLLRERPPIGEAWLTTKEPDDVSRDMDQLAELIGDHHENTEKLDEISPTWRQVDPSWSQQLAESKAALAALQPATGWFDQWQREPLERLVRATRTLGTALRTGQPSTEKLATAFGIPHDPSLELAGRLAELADLAGSPNPPEAEWLHPMVKAALDEARRVLSDLLRTYRSRREALQATFTESVLELDLRALHARFTEVHTGLKKLGGAYRADKATLAAATVSGKVTKDVLAKLDEAIEWKDLAERLGQAERRHAPQLGDRYYSSRNDADLDEIERAVALADRALALAAGDVKQTELARQIARSADPDPGLPMAAAAVSQMVTELRSGELNGLLPSVAAALEPLPVADAIQWCDAAVSVIGRLIETVAGVETATAPNMTLRDVERLLTLRVQNDELTDAVAQQRVRRGAELGSLTETEQASEILAARDWVTSVREHTGGRLRSATAQAVLRSELRPTEVRDPLDEYTKATTGVLAEFQDPYAEDLRSELTGSFVEAHDLLETMRSTTDELGEWRSYLEARTLLREAGWAATVDACEQRRIAADQVAATIERAVLARWVDQIVDEDSRLKPRRAVDRDKLRQTFQELDAALVADAAAGVINACSSRRPRSLAGGAGIVKQQSQLKRRHLPVRTLLERAGEAVQALKPCFMMSPLSVSQFLPPSLKFDVVIFDEASQVREADAICCIYRGTQLIVAGDAKQLPPTDFFTKVADGEDRDADDDMLDFESVLDRCKAQGFPSLPLNWHYRSQHEALITYSNRSFYDGRLHTFPGATFEAPDLGVELFRVDGQYQRGGSRDNPIEADAVVDRIVTHRRQHPDLTMGVVALSVAQRDAIETAIERRSGQDPELRELVTDDRLGGFFVKNLENVQGDERDLIIMSIGYGPDENGKLTMNFGPLNRNGGERRLNVAVTRARRRVEVVSSISAGDIDSDRPPVKHLARYLDYAERGPVALALDLEGSSGDADSPFEEEVLRAVRSMGYDAVPQVGVAGYRIDIGVRHPSKPGNFVLGVECDGAAYHSSKVARDRDRLRQQVLEGLGWRIHRIWSTAWFSERAKEERRLAAAIDQAVSAGAPPAASAQAAPPPEVVIDEFSFDEHPEWVFDYQPPELKTPPAFGGEFADPAARPVLMQQILEVVETFGPIHSDGVLDAMRRSWDIARTGRRIRDAFDAALATLVTQQRVETDGEFLQVPGAEPYVQVPSDADTTPRRVSAVPPGEQELAIVKLLEDAGATSPSALCRAWARLFGWRRVGADIEAAFEGAVERLIDGGKIEGPDPLRLCNGNSP